MSLRNDFHVANAHTSAYQTLGRFIALARQLTMSPAIKSSLESAPEKVVQNRSFTQIVLDDAMDAFATLMAKTIETSDVTFEDIPHEFYLKLMRDRHSSQITKEDAKDALKKHIDDINARPVSPQFSEVPTFIKLIMSEVEPQVLASVANTWATVIRNFSTLMMSEQGLAANNAAMEVVQKTMMEVQNHINEMLQSQPGMPGMPGANDNDDEDDGVKIHKVEDLGDLEEEMEKLIGMEEPKELIREIEARVRHLRILREEGLGSDKDGGGIEHFVFTGNPGTGKTTFARLIGKIYKDNGLLENGHVVEADRGDLVAGFVGQTALKTKEVINKALDGVLFIDEAYLLKGEGNDFGKEAMGTLLKGMEMNKDRLVVVIAGYPGPMNELVKSNPGLSRRFKYHMNYPDFKPEELMEIFDLNIEKLGRNITGAARQKAEEMLVANKQAMGEHFGNAGTVENLVELLSNKLSLELENDGTLDKVEKLRSEGKPVPQDLRDKLVTITPEIVEQTQLQGKRAISVSSGNIDASELGRKRDIPTEQPVPKFG